MSYCRKEGKDTIIFVTEEDDSRPSKAVFENLDMEDEPGLILPSGEINWSCPCLGGMATGPCGVEFREAFSCFHYSEEEPKGADCYEPFKTMQECMTKYPDLYGNYKEEETESPEKTLNEDNIDDSDDKAANDNSDQKEDSNSQTAPEKS